VLSTFDRYRGKTIGIGYIVDVRGVKKMEWFITNRRYQNHKYPAINKKIAIYSPIGQIFRPKQQKKLYKGDNTGTRFFAVTDNNSHHIKCNSYTITVCNRLSWIMTSYLGIKCTKPRHYLVHCYST
jgi:hypothetical protein